ncbi:MAG: hypothetical protein ABR572_10605 [Cryomorphaceae bacterium]|nr:hypothetical protein [Flavobacteriales bacterium]
MKSITKFILGIFAGIAVLVATTAFIIADPQADFTKQVVSLEDRIALSEITTENLKKGTFKSSLKFKQNKSDNPSKEFYGQEIIIADNPQVDRILIGVTNNLTSRVEIWNQNNFMETKELGFMDKMTWGATQTMSIDFYDQTSCKHQGKSKISMRFYDGTGFFGDIGTIHFDLTGYGDFSGDKKIGVFAKSIDSDDVNEPEFSDLSVWKNHNSFD